MLKLGPLYAGLDGGGREDRLLYTKELWVAKLAELKFTPKGVLQLLKQKGKKEISSKRVYGNVL